MSLSAQPRLCPQVSDAVNVSLLGRVRAEASLLLSRSPLANQFLPRNSYLPAIGRFLIVVTFLEDALRIMTQWTDQLIYLRDYRYSKPALFPAGDSIALLLRGPALASAC